MSAALEGPALVVGEVQDSLERLADELVSLGRESGRQALLALLAQALAALSELARVPDEERIERGVHALALLARELARNSDYEAERAASEVTRLGARLDELRGHALVRAGAREEHARDTNAGVASRRLLAGAPRSLPACSHGAPALHPLPDATRRASLAALAALAWSSELGAGAGASESAVSAAGLEVLEGWALDCCDEIGRYGRLRRAPLAAPWSPALEGFERALLVALDAFFALAEGGAAHSPVVELAGALARFAGSSWRDPHRAYVRTLVLACAEPAEALRAAVACLRRSHPDTHAACAEALALGVHPAIASAMERLCGGGEPELARVAVRVMRKRRAVRFAPLATLLGHPNIELRREVAAALGHARERAPASAVLSALLDDELDERVLAAAAESLLRLDEPRALDFVRQRLELELEAPGNLPHQVRARLVELVAIAGAPGDLALLLRCWHEPGGGSQGGAHGPHPREVAALGWFGHAGAVEPLLELMERQPAHDRPAPSSPSRRMSAYGRYAESCAEAAARALHRITGAGFALVPEGDAEYASLVPGRRADAWPVDVAAWRVACERSREAHKPGVKLRFGRPFELAQCLEELARPGVPSDVRRDAAFELGICAGGSAEPWVGDWTERQRAAQARTAAELLEDGALAPERRRHAPGEWLARRLGRRVFER